jgi:hypothetical protein
MHTYVTALPLSRKESKLYQLYGEGEQHGFAGQAAAYHKADWEGMVQHSVRLIAGSAMVEGSQTR